MGLSLTTKTGHSTAAAIFNALLRLNWWQKRKKGFHSGRWAPAAFSFIDILQPLFELHQKIRYLARRNTPLEKQTYELATEYLSCSFQEATEILPAFSLRNRLVPKLIPPKIPAAFYLYYENTDCKRYICLLLQTAFGSFKHPFIDSPQQNHRLYNVALSMLNFAQPLKLPFDPRLWQATENFTEQIVSELPSPFPVQDEFLREPYAYFTVRSPDHFHCTSFR